MAPKPRSASTDIATPMLILPYKGEKGNNHVIKLRNSITNTLNKVKPKIIYTGKKLSSKFSLKDKQIINHKHDVVYEFTCPDDNCSENYIGETGRRVSQRITEHARSDKRSHILQHSIENNHELANINNFTILGEGFHNTAKRRIAEALFIKEKSPSLNKQDQSVPLKLFN